MPRRIHCTRLDREDDALDFAPWPGELGQRVLDTIGKTAWSEWLTHQTMLINEHRLMPRDPATRTFLQAEMEKFLFGTGAEKPSGFTPQA